jgi:hypothetical protein
LLDQGSTREALEFPWQKDVEELISWAMGAVRVAVRAVGVGFRGPSPGQGRSDELRFEFLDPRRESNNIRSGYDVAGVTHG